MDRLDSTPAATPPHTSVRRWVFKVLSAFAIYVAWTLAARLRLDVSDLGQSLAHLSILQLTLLLLGIPFAWLATVFLAACFDQLVELASSGGKTAAQILGKLPLIIGKALGHMLQSATLLFRHWNFGLRYKRRIVENYALFNDRGLGLINAARLDLENVYVELQISNRVTHAGRQLLGQPVPGRQTIWAFLDLMKPGRALALLGAPGSGKTTLLQNLLLVFAAGRQARFKQKKFLPIFVELRNVVSAFESDSSPSLDKVIRTYWARDSRMSDLMREEPQNWLEQRLRSKRVLVLIDGLDEVPQAWRAQVSTWLQNRMRSESQRGCRFLLTSRPGGYESAPLEDAVVLEIQPFSKEQVNRFVESWYVANELATTGSHKSSQSTLRHAAEQAGDLRERLSKNADLQELAANPLLLTMVCMIHRYRGALPGSRSQLYGEICQVLLERWRQAKAIAEELTGEQKLAVLRPLAREFMQREAREIPVVDIESCIRKHLKYIGYLRNNDPTAVIRFLKSVQASSGLLLEKEAGVWSFAHKTFQEYLVSDYWLRVPSEAPEWSKIVAQDWWREACLLYAARADVSDLVTAALDAEAPASWSLAFQCLTESHGMRPEVRTRAEKMLRSALSSRSSDIFTPASRALHHLRQMQVKPVAETLEQRASLITQAEYQLYLNSLSARDRVRMMPPHWASEYFNGDPEAPLAGVFPWQAIAYVDSINRGVAAPTWRLPKPTEAVMLENTGNRYWFDSGNLSAAVIESGSRNPPKSEIENNDFPANLKLGGLALELHDLMTCADSIAGAIWVSGSQDRAPFLAIAYSLKLAVAKAFAHEEDAAEKSASEHGFTRPLIDELIYAIKADISGKAVLLEIGRKRKRPAFTFGIVERDLNSEQRPPEYFDGSRLNPRQELLNGLNQLVDHTFELTTSALAWKKYAACLLRIPMRYIGERKRKEFLDAGQTLAVIMRRESGLANPYEGIQLVRDKRNL